MPPVSDLLASLSAPIAGAAASLAGGEPPEVALERPSDPTHGDYATSVALRLAPVLKRSPRAIAEDIASRIRGGADVAQIEIAGPGFVNLRLAPAWYHRALAEMLAVGDRYGAGTPTAVENILVELVSANPTGDLTVASARNGAYGDSVGRLLAFAGHDVVREYYFNDAGVQIDRFVESIRARKRGELPAEDGYPGQEPIDLAAVIDLPADAGLEAWRDVAIPMMFNRIKTTMRRLRIDVDIWFSERDLHASGAVERAISRARAAGHVYEHGGATWLATSPFGDDKDRVVLRSDGSPTYFAADLAYLEHKFSRGHQRLIYVLGADHHGYVGRLKAAASCLGYDPDAVEVPIYQMVTVSGERMGKRRGNVVTSDELLDAIGPDATRYFLVARSHDQGMDIDLDLAARTERENPVYYVQYANARCASILRKAAEFGLVPHVAAWKHRPETAEADIIKRLAEWPTVVREAIDRRAPHRVVAWVHALAGEYHVFQHDIPVLKANDDDARSFRLALVACTATAIRTALQLVGAEAPEVM
jgi:arginyl-tRNA synthetase